MDVDLSSSSSHTQPLDSSASSSSKAAPRPPPSPASIKRHQAFRSRLLGRSFGRRKSLTLDEAEAAEPTKGRDGNDDEEEHEEQEKEIEEAGSSNKMKGVKEKLTRGGGSKGKALAKGKGKEKESVGPSGQTWTPLEKQVLQLKEENPGVLLIFEVGCTFKSVSHSIVSSIYVIKILTLLFTSAQTSASSSARMQRSFLALSSAMLHAQP
jgi:hypothetical protein